MTSLLPVSSVFCFYSQQQKQLGSGVTDVIVDPSTVIPSYPDTYPSTVIPSYPDTYPSTVIPSYPDTYY